MLDRLRLLLRVHGKLTVAIINADLETPSSATYAKRFGRTINAYERIGWLGAQKFRNLAAANTALGPLRASFNAAKREALIAGLPPPLWRTQSPRQVARAAARERRSDLMKDE